MRLSKFGRLLTSGAGIVRLMDDLGSAMAVERDMLMLGGGNPGRVPEVEARLRRRMERMLANGDEFERLVGVYDPPGGHPEFIAALARLLRRECAWPIGPENVAITNGSQSASFMLFNLFAGEGEDGRPGRVLLPLTPEYIGYADQGITRPFFSAARPSIEHLDEQTFKYRVDFDSLTLGNDTAALCVSRPTNPTGNVLTDEEVDTLSSLARAHEVPLIVDNAYGTPFPNIIFTDATPRWDEHMVVCMSLSKLGLPGARTGIVIAREEIVRAVVAMNAIINLTTGGFGAALALDLVASGEVIALSRDVVRPFYERKARAAAEFLRRELADVDFHLHKPEGAIFLWLWFRGLPISSRELYERLKRRGVLVLSGHYFFPGLEGPWRHTEECIRVTYSQDDATVARGLAIIADEVRRAYAEGRG